MSIADKLDAAKMPRETAAVTLDPAAMQVTSEAMASPPSAEFYSDVLTFLLNGERVTLVDPDLTVLLVDFLRRPEIGLTGMKLVCGEGGCGACTVTVSRYDPVTKATSSRPVNACLHPLCALDGASVTTVEGIGSTRTGLHPIQRRVAECNGSQCGFCTPGWVMSMYGLLQNDPAPTAQTIEDHFDGNLCRCTGMRPILDAMQTFADGNGVPEPAPLTLAGEETIALADALAFPRAAASLEAAARVLASGGRFALAAQLAGAADQSCRDLDVVPNPLRLRLRAGFDHAREALGEEDCARELEAGRKLTITDALERALAEVEALEPAKSVPAGEPRLGGG